MYARALIAIFVLAAVFIGGVRTGRMAAGIEWEEKVAAAEVAARETESEYASRLAKAISERDDALATVRSLRDASGRLRQQADARAARDLSEAAGGACEHCAERLAKCERLLGEGAEMAGEGAELSVRIAADKDAIAGLLTPLGRKE